MASTRGWSLPAMPSQVGSELLGRHARQALQRPGASVDHHRSSTSRVRRCTSTPLCRRGSGRRSSRGKVRHSVHPSVRPTLRRGCTAAGPSPRTAGTARARNRRSGRNAGLACLQPPATWRRSPPPSPTSVSWSAGDATRHTTTSSPGSTCAHCLMAARIARAGWTTAPCGPMDLAGRVLSLARWA